MKVLDFYKHEIFLFKHQEELGRKNSLTEFIYFIRNTGSLGKIDFSLVNSDETLHLNMSAKENFLLEAIEKSLVNIQDDYFTEKLHSIKNEYTLELIKLIPNVYTKVNLFSKTERILISVVKSLLSDSEYLFYIEAKENLPTKIQEAIKNAFLYEAKNERRKIFIGPSNIDHWLDITTHLISRNARDEFIRKENPFSKVSPKIKRDYNFVLTKKAN